MNMFEYCSGKCNLSDQLANLDEIGTLLFKNV